MDDHPVGSGGAAIATGRARGARSARARRVVTGRRWVALAAGFPGSPGCRAFGRAARGESVAAGAGVDAVPAAAAGVAAPGGIVLTP